MGENLMSVEDLYLFLGRDRKRMSRWVNDRIIRNACLNEGTHYTLSRSREKGKKITVMVTPTVAKYLCISEDTMLAKRALELLEKNQTIPKL